MELFEGNDVDNKNLINRSNMSKTHGRQLIVVRDHQNENLRVSSKKCASKHKFTNAPQLKGDGLLLSRS